MRHWLILAAGLAAASAASANDTAASTAAGGLVLKRTDAIEMVSEDLYISASEIRVRYVFRNRTARDVETIVAFPMPDRDLSQDFGQETVYPSGFRTKVAGKPVEAKLERKAILKGKDHSGLLRQLRIPLIDGSGKAMDRLPPAEKRRLVSLGLAGEEQWDDDGKGMKDHLIPLWTVKETYYWTQRFPAGRELMIEHRYVPGAGGSVDTVLVSEYFKPDDPEVGAMIARYCIDREFLARVERLRKAGAVVPPTWIDYVLTTGANWARPIGDFRLVIDKGRPDNLVSFCETGVRKISPTRFEVRRKNWRPTRDLHVLILEPNKYSR
jgi:hypothetical protein